MTVGMTVAGVAAGSTRTVLAQGLTGASVEVTAVDDSGVPVPRALVILSEFGTGAKRTVTAGERGTYLFASVAVGSYRVEARAIGMVPASIEALSLHLGDRARVRLVLGNPAAHDLGNVAINTAPLKDPGAGGPAIGIPREALRGLPLLNRDFVGLFAMSPQAIGPGSLWVSGQHSRFNAIQIDGATGNDLFGTNVTPGSNAGGRSVSLEALEEIRILVAPFDVRQGGFSGGLINAVTRSGSNTRHGAAFSSYSRSQLVGSDTAGSGVPAFDQIQYGISLGGPIIRDRFHYFAVAELQSRSTRFAGPAADDPATGVTEATALRAARVFRDRFGFDPGGTEAPDLREPNGNLFLKLSWHPSDGHSLELSQSLSQARADALNRTIRNLNNFSGWQLSRSGSMSRSRAYNVRLKAFSAFGAYTNEAMAGVTTIEDDVNSRNKVPLFIVGADLPNTYLAAGSLKDAQGTKTTQHVLELTDNISWNRGAHLFTLGTQNVLIHVRDNFFLGSWGVWTFDSVEDLEKEQPSRYEIALPLIEGGPLADYSSALLSAYVQDQWRPYDRLTITAGIRTDIPVFDPPRTNPVLASNQQLGGIDTGRFPSGNTVLAPRIGLAWEFGNKRRSMLRGGIGAFTARPPMVWLTGAYSATGQEQATLVCQRSDGVPSPTSDIRRLPVRCLNAGSTSVPTVSYFDSRFRFPQAIKYVAGLDHDFGHSLLGSLDVIYTRSRNTLFLNDVNLVERGLNGEGRAMYGAFTSDGVAQPTRVDSLRFGPVYRYENISADRSASVSLSAQRRWHSGGLIQVGYDWSRTTDVMSMAGYNSTVIFRSNPVDGTLAHRIPRRSARDVPHSFVAVAIVPAGSRTTVSTFFRARSGTPYAFTVSGDANADGTQRNDLAYIPRGPGDLSLANPEAYPALDAFIESEPCLRPQRGRIMTRNSCRNPGVMSLDGRIARKVWTRDARGVEIAADLFNLPNMLNRHWGLVRETSSREDAPLLPVTGWDGTMNRPRYSIPTAANGQAILPSAERVVPDASRWRVQLGARYDF